MYWKSNLQFTPNMVYCVLMDIFFDKEAAKKVFFFKFHGHKGLTPPPPALELSGNNIFLFFFALALKEGIFS